MELHTQQPNCFAVNCSRNLNSISIPTYRSTCRCCLVAKYPHPFVCKHTPSVSTWLVVFSYLIVLLIFSFQHNHCISRKYQRYLICRQKSIIEVAESIKLVRIENEQKKNSLHYYKLSSKTKLHICLNYIDSIIKQFCSLPFPSQATVTHIRRYFAYALSL